MILLSHHLMVLTHEWTHGTIAWLAGIKTSPFDIQYGDLALWNTDEKVDYDALIAAGRGVTASLIAISPLIVNSILFAVCIVLFRQLAGDHWKWLAQFLYWFAIWNIGEVFSYMPVRTFSPRGDVGYFLRGLRLSPWWVVIAGSLLVAIGLWLALSKGLPQYFALASITQLPLQRSILWTTSFILFFWCGGVAFRYYGPADSRSPWSLASAGLGVLSVILFDPAL